MIHHEMTLAYKLPGGWMADYVDGIMAGRARARRCSACGRVSFVPIRTCPCGSSDGVWIDLTGIATVIHRTSGSDGDFASVRFDGADTNTVVALDGFSADQKRGRLIPPQGDLPALVLAPLEKGIEP